MIQKLIAILMHRCPRCRKGKMFDSKITEFSQPFQMRTSCPVCKLSYYPEPGFYYGAMFISYIITAFYCLGFTGLCILLFGMSVEGAFGLLLITLALLYIWFYRTARALWIHINVRHDPRAVEKYGDLPDTPPPAFVNRNF
jgi:uncharacterized protein (DUF983 family)